MTPIKVEGDHVNEEQSTKYKLLCRDGYSLSDGTIIKSQNLKV